MLWKVIQCRSFIKTVLTKNISCMKVKTKTGKPKYFFSKKKNGDDLPGTIPDGYEIYERPGGMVYLRKFQKTPILKEELEYVQKKIAGMVNCDRDQEMAACENCWKSDFPVSTTGTRTFSPKCFTTDSKPRSKRAKLFLRSTIFQCHADFEICLGGREQKIVFRFVTVN